MKLSKVIAEKKDAGVLFTISKDATLRDAAKKMVANRTGYLLVTEIEQKDHLNYAGLFTYVDMIRAIGMENANLDTTRVESFMTKRLIVASNNDDVDYVMNVMLRHDITHLPIIQEKRICSVVSRSDILNSINDEKDIELQWLSDYTGNPSGSRNQVY